MESSLSLSEIKKRVKSSFVNLMIRQIALRAIGFISINLILARILSVEVIGIFNIATAIITFFAFFSDIGLAASLIQKREKVEHADIKTTFTIQQLIVGFLSLVIIFGAPYFGNFYNLNDQGIWLVRILGVSFFLSSLKVIPSVLLERALKFGPLVTVEILETLIFNVLLVVLVIKGMQIEAFSYAVLARSLVGVTTIYLLAPVRLGIGIDRNAASKLLSFGLPYQLNSILALIKDRLVPLVIARMVGPVGMGYITWSQAMAFLPLEVMSIVIRITFPAFSRLQDDTKSLISAIEKSLFVTSLIVYPFIFGMGALLPAVVDYIVSPKWQPAVASFYLFAFSTFWAVISTTLTNVLNAVGKIKITLRLMIFWTVVTWGLTPVLVYFYGFIGVGIASFVISFTSVITIFLVRRSYPIQVFESIWLPLFGSILMSIIVYLFSKFFVHEAITLVIAIILGIIIYFGFIFLFGKERILRDLKNLRDV